MYSQVLRESEETWHGRQKPRLVQCEKNGTGIASFGGGATSQRMKVASGTWKRYRKGFCSRRCSWSLRRNAAVLTPSFDPVRPILDRSHDWKRISKCCVKPPSRWPFVTTAIGNEYELLGWPCLPGEALLGWLEIREPAGRYCAETPLVWGEFRHKYTQEPENPKFYKWGIWSLPPQNKW